MRSNDGDYYRGRASAERDNAKAADRRNVAEIHLELARQYDALAVDAELRPTLKVNFEKRQSRSVA